MHLVMSGNTTGTVKATGDLVTTRGKHTRRKTRNSEYKKTRMAISGLRTEAYIHLMTGFKAQYESCTKVRTLIHLLLVMSNPRIGILG